MPPMKAIKFLLLIACAALVLTSIIRHLKPPHIGFTFNLPFHGEKSEKDDESKADAEDDDEDSDDEDAPASPGAGNGVQWTLTTKDDGRALSFTYSSSHPAGPECKVEGDPTAMGRREIPWDERSKTLVVDKIPVFIRYVPNGPRAVTLEGRNDMLQAVKIVDGALEVVCPLTLEGGPELFPHVTVSGYALKGFTLPGNSRLFLDAVKQEALTLSIEGGGSKIDGAGAVEKLSVLVKGDSNIDLPGVTADTAHVQLSDGGGAKLSASREGDVTITGDGELEWSKTPAHQQTNVSGKGRIISAQ